MPRRIYFDNAATSFPKPLGVLQVMTCYAQEIGASAGRGIYAEAMESGRIIQETRQNLCRLLNATSPDHMVMTFNCTDGLVLAIKGILTRPGDHVITTRMEHNSVVRPIEALREQLGIEVTCIPADSIGLIDPEDIRRAVRPNTKLIAIVHGSNVCGSVQDIAAVGQIARQGGITFLVDAAQTIGHIPIDVQALGVDLLAFPGHKGLLGPLGTGALYVRPGMEKHLRPLREGGTGSKSEIPRQPDFMPDRFEAGSHNALGICGLNEGVKYLLEQGMESIRRHERQLCQAFLEATGTMEHVTVYGPRNVDQRVGVFSVTIEGYEPAELSAILEDRFGLLTRPGLHCAPFAHQAIGSFDRGGTCRFSTGPFTTLEDIHQATCALAELCRHGWRLT